MTPKNPPNKSLLVVIINQIKGVVPKKTLRTTKKQKKVKKKKKDKTPFQEKDSTSIPVVDAPDGWVG